MVLYYGGTYCTTRTANLLQLSANTAGHPLPKAEGSTLPVRYLQLRTSSILGTRMMEKSKEMIVDLGSKPPPVWQTAPIRSKLAAG